MSELKVGLLAIASIIAIAYMSVKITANQSGFGDYMKYRTVIKDASGIFPKTPIKVAGINAGRIVDIVLSGNEALIEFEVLEKVRITEGSKLRIKSVGFLGDKYLEIYVAPHSDKVIADGGFIEAIEGGGVESLVQDASDVMKDVKSIVSSLKESLVPVEGEPPVTKILNDVQDVVANAKDVAASLRNLVTGNEEKMNAVIDNLEAFTASLKYHLDQNQKESIVHDLRGVLSEITTMSQDLKDIVRDIKNGKGTIGQIVVKDEIADEVKSTLSSVQKIVSKVDAIRTELSLYSGVNSEYGGSTDGSLSIFPSPERFYLLGLATSDLGVEKKKRTTTITNGVESVQEERTLYRDTYRFNLQLGRKLHNWSFRGGLIESTGGIGVDYRFDPLRTIFTSELFDYRQGNGFNLRVMANIHIWNVIYGRLSVEDALNGNRSYSASVGLHFMDEDLKGLIGFFL